MLWTREFQQQLQTGSYIGGLAPQFRLLVGSRCVVDRDMLGEWEADVASVLEVLSHPGTATYPSTDKDNAHILGGGMWPTGHEYRYGVGLTTDISFGSARLNPRTFQYTGAALSCGVTAWAADKLGKMPPGCFARLQVRMITHTHTKTAKEWAPDIHSLDDPYSTSGGMSDVDLAYNQFFDIFIGVYKGLKCANGKYTATFASALEGAKTRKTDDHSDRGNPHRYRWYAGCGTTAKTVDTFTGHELSVFKSVQMDLSHDDAVEGFFGNTWKKTDTLYPGAAFGGDTYHYGGFEAYGGCSLGVMQSQCWVEATNSSGKKTFLRYSALGVGPGDSSILLNAHSTITEMPLPGYFKRHVGAMEPYTLAAESTLRNVCVVHGTPVTELVNTLYVQGYHRNMVPGIFGRGYAERPYAGGPLDPINHNEIMNAHLEFNSLFASAAGRHPSEQDVPFRFTVNRPSTNGLSDITRRAGKWGVFPRFKLGGWAIHVVRGDSSKKGNNRAVDFITEKHIESYEWNKQESDTIGGYNYVEYQTSDPDVPGSLSSDFRYPYTVGSRKASGGETYHGWPQLGQLIVATQDCAQGHGETTLPHTDAGGRWNFRFAEYHKEYLLRDFWFAAREEAKVTLRGLAFAHIEPGDFVHIVIPESSRPHGITSPGLTRHVLDSSGRTGPLEDLEHSDEMDDTFGNSFRYPPWLCTESHKDWVKGFVTLTLSRVTGTNGRLGDTNQSSDADLRGIAEKRITDCP